MLDRSLLSWDLNAPDPLREVAAGVLLDDPMPVDAVRVALEIQRAVPDVGEHRVGHSLVVRGEVSLGGARREQLLVGARDLDPPATCAYGKAHDGIPILNDMGRPAKLTRLVAAILGVVVLWSVAAFLILAGPTAARANEEPPGFWYGTDSSYVQVAGSAPYRMPVLGGSYGGYMGMAGSWEWWLGCPGRFLNWSKINAAQADTNLRSYGRGVGTGAYWVMGGPGVDPNYNGTSREAKTSGARQAARALADIRGFPTPRRVLYPVLWMDIELPGITPAPDNGWKSVYTSPCSGHVKQSSVPVPAAVDRADFDGFRGYVRAHSSFRPGVYSAPVVWRRIFGTGSERLITGTDEWTYEPETSHLTRAPSGWCLKGGGCAEFFGGVTRASSHALMWQFSGGGGVRNGLGDFDQIFAPAH
jgi:hypothetical protein